MNTLESEVSELRMNNGKERSRLTTLGSNLNSLSDVINDDENKLDQLEAEISRVRELSLRPLESTDEIAMKIRNDIWERLGGPILDTLIVEHRRAILINNITPSYVEQKDF